MFNEKIVKIDKNTILHIFSIDKFSGKLEKLINENLSKIHSNNSCDL